MRSSSSWIISSVVSADHAGEDERGTGHRWCLEVDLRLVESLDGRGAAGTAPPAVDVRAQCLIGDCLLAQALADHRDGRLALAKAGNAHVLGEIAERVLECVVDVVRVDLDAELDLVVLEGL
jgi:hypothetical protein